MFQNLRVTTIIGCFGTCAGAWLKVFSVPPDMFWLGFLGQTVVAISQVFVLNVPPRLAAVWFGEDQVSVACSIGVFGNQVSSFLIIVTVPKIHKTLCYFAICYLPIRICLIENVPSKHDSMRAEVSTKSDKVYLLSSSTALKSPLLT